MKLCKENSVDIFGVAETKTFHDKFCEASELIGGWDRDIQKFSTGHAIRFGLDGIETYGSGKATPCIQCCSSSS